MKISVANPTGFCFGVRRAIDALERALALGAVVSIGMPIHNPQEVGRLVEMGLVVVSSVSEVPRGGVKVFIRAHGEPREVYEKLDSLGVEIIDGTCPFVKRVQDEASELARRGFSVVLLGDKNHPEVRSIVGHTDAKILVVASPEDAAKIGRREKIGLISQTTQREEDFERLAEILSDKCGLIEISNTICRATVERQEAVRKLADTVGGIIVVGGRNSANTVKLYEIAKSRGTDAVLVETAGELERGWVLGKTGIGVAAGASTPEWLIATITKAVANMTAE